jgi:hypothetical protein
MRAQRVVVAAVVCALPGVAGAQDASEESSPSAPASASTETEVRTRGTQPNERTAPAPAADTRASSERERREREDDGRQIDYLWIQPEGGLSYTDLTALSSTGRLLPTLTQFQGFGFHGGVSVGVRFGWVALAAQGTIARFDGTAMDRIGNLPPSTSNQAFDLGQATVDVHVRFPVPVIEPYVRAGFGYAWLGNFQLNEMYRESTSTVHGWTAKVGAGVDVWLAKVFTIGAGIDLGVLNLRRGGVMRDDSVCPTTDPRCIELRQDGDAVGLLAHLHVQLGLHF